MHNDSEVGHLQAVESDGHPSIVRIDNNQPRVESWTGTSSSASSASSSATASVSLPSSPSRPLSCLHSILQRPSSSSRHHFQWLIPHGPQLEVINSLKYRLGSSRPLPILLRFVIEECLFCFIPMMQNFYQMVSHLCCLRPPITRRADTTGFCRVNIKLEQQDIPPLVRLVDDLRDGVRLIQVSPLSQTSTNPPKDYRC